MVSYRRNTRIVPTILTVVIIVIAIVGLVSLARLIFFSGSSRPAEESKVDTSRQSLLDTSAGSAVSMTVRGPIVADENFRSYSITITPNARSLKTYTGYLGKVLEQDKLGNNTAAYSEFVHALDKANMSSGKQLADEKNDVRGICATGRVYEFKVLKDNKVVQTLWTSTCSGSQGSLKANETQLSQLFQSQIPDARDLLRGLSV